MNIKMGYIVYSVDNIMRNCEFNQDFNRDFNNDDLDIILNNYDINEDKRIKVILKPKKEITIKEFCLQTDEILENDSRVFLNGYETWTESREFTLSEKIPRLNKIAWNIMNTYGDYWFYKDSKDSLHSFTYTYIRKKEGIVLLGSLSEATGYTIFDYEKNSLKIFKDCNGLVINNEYEAFDLFICEGEENFLFDKYFQYMNLPKLKVSPCKGWTSWYNYYTKINEEIILSNLRNFKNKDIPIEIFQIDDGYQNAVGDWLKVNNKFPRGMKFISNEIKRCGYKSGLWLAPFICEKKSILYKEHPNWVIKKAGFNPLWSGRFYVLDFYNEEVQDYLREVFKTVLYNWEYDMVKLDFLYAVALIPRKDKTRGQIMYEALKFLREIAGDKLILGCGVPLGSAFGLVDYCRIGSDVSLTWEDKLLERLHYRERVSTINSIKSTIGRRHLNERAFLNDPDVFILRSKNNRLTKDQRFTLFLLNTLLGGLVFTSDNIEEYSKEELQIYMSQFQFINKNVKKVEQNVDILKIFFSMKNKEYVALSNLSCNEEKVYIPQENYINMKSQVLQENCEIILKPYESVCMYKVNLN